MYSGLEFFEESETKSISKYANISGFFERNFEVFKSIKQISTNIVNLFNLFQNLY